MTPETQLIEQDIESYLEKYQKKELLRFVTIGSVDDGKSTLIGRLLNDTNSVYIDQLGAAKKTMDGEIDLALITDGLKAEREQGITIDVAYRYFTTEKRKFIIADTPGHEQYTRNMATGASNAQVAIILIDARFGVLAQSKRHAFITSLLGIPHLVVCINKMDLVEFSETSFNNIKEDFETFGQSLRFKSTTFIPISAIEGDNITTQSPHTPWYEGSPLLEFLENVTVERNILFDEFCFPVQYVLRPNLNFRGYCGNVAGGVVRPGDEIVALPSGKSTRVKAIITYDGPLEVAYPPMAVTITLEDEIDVSRGDMLVHKTNILHMSRKVDAHLVWMNNQPLDLHRQYLIKHTTSTVTGLVEKVHFIHNIHTLKAVPAETLHLNEIGKVTLNLNRPLILDLYKNNRQAGSFILIDRLTNATVAAGMIDSYQTDEQHDFRVMADRITPLQRSKRFAQKPCLIWMTGLPGCGKLILARCLEKKLFESGHFPYVMETKYLPKITDPHARGELFNKILDYASVFLDMGAITIAAFTSPVEKDRNYIRQQFRDKDLVSVYLKADLETCQNRLRSQDRLAAQALLDFEEPQQADIIIDANNMDIHKEADRLIQYLEKNGILV